MEKLKDVIEIRGIGYPCKATLVRRTKKKAMYKRSDGYYEVFKVKIKPAGSVFGKPLPEREVYPGNEDFGFFAWCFSNRENADIRYDSL
jgi:hypothetical protein